MLEVRRLADWTAAERYHQEWNAIVTTHAGSSFGVPSIFQTYEWNHAWWQAFGVSDELLLLAVFEESRAVGFAPFMVTQRHFPLRRRMIRFIGSPNLASDYCACVRAPGRDDVLHKIVGWLDAHPGIWDEIEFTNMIEGSPELAIFSKCSSGFMSKSEESYRCDAPTIVLRNSIDNFKLVSHSSLKRHFNWFKKKGVLTYGHIATAAAIHSRLDDFFEQHISRRSLIGTKSQFLNEPEREFYRILVDKLTPSDWMRFFSVELDGKAIAYHLGFEFAGKYYWYKPTFNVTYAKNSPGEVLLKTLFEYAIEHKITEFDFTAGSEAFKYRFSNHVRKLHRLRVFRTWQRYTMFRVKTRSLNLARRVFRSIKSVTKI
jgi:CelD/BcsL family acetyltransferase involved in cellulose biosynthesis